MSSTEGKKDLNQGRAPNEKTDTSNLLAGGQGALLLGQVGRPAPTPSCLLAGPAALPPHADEACEPAHAQLRALGAGLRPAAPGQEAATFAV